VTGIEIRPARPDELSAVAVLRWRWSQENRGTPALPQADFVPRFVAWARANEASHRCLVGLRDGAVIGMAWLATVPRVPYPGALDRASGDVQCVYVAPAERDGGVGSRLIDAVLALARDLGLERVTVHSSDRAVPAYVRRGFAVCPQLLQADLTATA
jgi:GNAT superfamily N-acetyltransferase